MKKETIQKVINFVITVLTAVLSAFCVQSCKLYFSSPTDFTDFTDLHRSSSFQATVLTKLHGKNSARRKICENLCNLWETNINH